MDDIATHSTDGPGSVRPASPDDLDALGALYAHYVRTSPATFDLEAPMRETWAARLRAAERACHPWLVAELGGAFAGYATASEFRPKRAFRTTVETTIYLSPEARGRGLGRQLYGELLEQCAAAGFQVAVVMITVPNAASVALHEGLGFEPVGVLGAVGHKLGEWHDAGIWQRRLSGPGA